MARPRPSDQGRRHDGCTTAAGEEEGVLQEFKDFLNQGDFVTIAVGLIIALYFQQIVDSILVGVLFPIIAAIFGKPDFQRHRLRHRRRPHQHRPRDQRHHLVHRRRGAAVPDPEGVQPHARHEDGARPTPSCRSCARSATRCGAAVAARLRWGPTTTAIAGASTIPTGSGARRPTAIDWIEPFDRVIDRSIEPAARWFTGGVLNTCANAVDRHVAGGRGDQLAIVYDSPVTATVRTLTYAALRDEVARLAGALAGARRGQGRRRHHLHADGARGRDRHARPAPASAPCTRSCSAASRPTSWRCASTTPGRR